MRGVELTQAIAARVEAVRERLEGDLKTSPAAWRRLTWRSFAKRIGLSEEALRDRRRGTVQFDVHDVIRICREFNVRAEYLLRGEEPMLHIDVVNDLTPPGFSGMLHLHMVEFLAVKLEQDPAWVAAHLPDADLLLQSVELGVSDALDMDVKSGIEDRILANNVREAILNRIGSGPARPSVPDDFLSSVGNQKLRHAISDIGTQGARQPTADPETTDTKSGRSAR